MLRSVPSATLIRSIRCTHPSLFPLLIPRTPAPEVRARCSDPTHSPPQFDPSAVRTPPYFHSFPTYPRPRTEGALLRSDPFRRPVLPHLLRASLPISTASLRIPVPELRARRSAPTHPPPQFDPSAARTPPCSNSCPHVPRPRSEGALLRSDPSATPIRPICCAHPSLFQQLPLRTCSGAYTYLFGRLCIAAQP